MDESEALVERAEILEDVRRVAERQIEAGEGVPHEEAGARVLARLSEWESRGRRSVHFET